MQDSMTQKEERGRKSVRGREAEGERGGGE